jgi:hypothetical protein
MHLMDYDDFGIYHNCDRQDIRTLAINKIMEGQTEEQILESIQLVYNLEKSEIDDILNDEIL